MNNPNWWLEWSKQRLTCSLKEAQHAHLIRQSQGSVVDVSLLLVRLGRWAVGLTFWVKNMLYQETSRVGLYPYPPFK